ncbi:MAG: acetyl-CoA carboxylase biotin carboxyl carrier protein, partial [Pyrinomonadaceae bacterium]|nr:acetyl-CoA carboxylase biotin carboxyl carrier protein [Pyrinomonadaceae bacterium]
AAAATTQTTQESPVSSSTAPPTSPQSAGATVSGQAAPAVATTTTSPATANAPATETAAGVGAMSTEEELQVITSPIVGTFYRAPSPNSEPFVRAGSHVEPDTVVCIIEAMKLMNEIQSEIAGVVEKIYVENGQPVEYGQSLFGIKK